MIQFVSTFPPIVCGIGAYTDYLTRYLKPESWTASSFRLDQSSKTSHIPLLRENVSYELGLDDGSVRRAAQSSVIWFQHAFGIWGKEVDFFVRLVANARESGARTIASFHTIHFESTETEFGLTEAEQRLMSAVLPLLDAATVFSDGALLALSKAFPQFQSRIVVLRHGVHQYPPGDQHAARRRLLSYLRNAATIPISQREQIAAISTEFLASETIIIGNLGFISRDKDPLALYELAGHVRRRLPCRKVIAVYVGKVQDRRDRMTADTDDLVRQLKSLDDGQQNLFFEDYLPEDMLQSAFRAFDASVFWCRSATQSGRMAHAQGSGTCVVGRRIEGVGETLDLAGLPAAVSLEDLADKIVTLVLDPRLRTRTARMCEKYASRYSFRNQARKHLRLMEALDCGYQLPEMDRARPDITFILPRLAIARRSGLETLLNQNLAFLNVSDDGDLYPLPRQYHRIPLRDGVAIPPESMKTAIEWIRTKIAKQKVVIFCRYGKGRSASVAIGYLCVTAGLPYRQAVEVVNLRRDGASPLPDLVRTIEIASKTD